MKANFVGALYGLVFSLMFVLLFGLIYGIKRWKRRSDYEKMEVKIIIKN